jgi:hypothetical protein
MAGNPSGAGNLRDLNRSQMAARSGAIMDAQE